MSFWKNLEDSVAAFFSGVSKEVMVFLSGAAKNIEANGGAVLVQIITDAVVAESHTSGTGAQKFASASASIVSDLQAKGMPVVMSAINAGIEAAVGNLPQTTSAVAAIAPVETPPSA